jgi:hypothetical protein
MFDSVKLSDNSLYSNGNNNKDTDILINAVFNSNSPTDILSGKQMVAEDIDNSGSVDIDDIMASLRHNAGIQEIDNFAMVNKGTSSEFKSLLAMEGLTMANYELIAKGDLDSSGGFLMSNMIDIV